jgi:hypothetical protein
MGYVERVGVSCGVSTACTKALSRGECDAVDVDALLDKELGLAAPLSG